jgi:hypothetical protein
MRRLAVSLSLVTVPAIAIACGKRDVPANQAQRERRTSESQIADTTRGETFDAQPDTAGSVIGGKGCPANTPDSARITETLVLCGDRAKRGSDLITLPLDSVEFGAGRYIEKTHSYVPAPDTTHWLIITRRMGPDVLRIAQGPVAYTAPTLVTFTLGLRAADSIGVAGCRRNHGAADRAIVAILKYVPGPEWLPARRAWRVVRAPLGLKELPADQIECPNEEGD